MSFNFGDGSTQTTASGVLEKIWVPCDGRTVSTKSGNNMTIQNVTTVQTLGGTNYYTANGSQITYTPPTGTTLVVYEYAYVQKWTDTHGICHYKFNNAGVVQSNSYYSISANGQLENLIHFKFPINIGGSTNADTGQLASWGSSRTLKLEARRYGGSNEGAIHSTYYSDGTDTHRFHQPCVGVTAIAGV